ncbi:hypothetical protein [Spirosoma rhododendri]|uniref:Uncharacterized protein n=1 Tax=Spirosoma rhododendri TaxID=2728024 RepID=A0A7L5DS78_9BACT|nr:hypothetical protein [Spirosoma rhododendri]QJD80103.1 hypothetical protein HH216_18060 [Spirosoma rhododendri]
MSFSERLRSLVRSTPAAPPASSLAPAVKPPLPAPVSAVAGVAQVPAEPLPTWLTDEETLRDEGVLYGLSDADPDDKLALIRVYSSRQTAPLTQTIGQLTAQIRELTAQLTQHEQQQQAIRQRLDSLRNQQLTAPHPARSIGSLALGIGSGAGAFFLIDQALQPAYGNLFISLGICLAGLAGPFSQPAEPDRQRAIGWFLNTLGLPLAVSGFVLATAAANESIGQALMLSGLLLVLLPTAGRLMGSGLRAMSSRAVRATYPALIDELATQAAVVQQEINIVGAQKAGLTALLNQNEIELTRQHAQRDALIQLFLSEFALARSLRDRLTENQREALFT